MRIKTMSFLNSYKVEQKEIYTRLNIPFKLEDGVYVSDWSKPLSKEATDLEKVMRTYDDIDLEYTVRAVLTDTGFYQYLFMGERRDLHDLGGTFETGDIDIMTIRESFLEFEEGKLVSY